jgi:hypothetical protein
MAEVFGEYGFKVSKKYLRASPDCSRPQAQAMFHLAAFVNEEDAANTLLMFYYIGHGWSENLATGALKFAGYVSVARLDAVVR